MAAEEKMIDRIKALLAKAEATPFPEEAEAFSAKAAELMEKYRVDPEQVLDRSAEFVRHTFVLSNFKYLRPSLDLLCAVARHYGVIVMIPSTGNSKTPTLVGDPKDIEATLLMFGSLAIQRDRACLREPVPMGYNTNSFRNSFCIGYARRISMRLRDIRKAAVQEAVAEGNSMALEVYGQIDKVKEFVGGGTVNQNRPNVVGAAAARGYEEGGAASLGHNEVGGHGRRAIGA